MLRQFTVDHKVSRWITFEQAGVPSATHTERTMPCRCPCRQRMAEQQRVVFVQRRWLDISRQLRIRWRDNCSNPSIVVVIHSSFLIFETLGDGSLRRVDSTTTSQDARERVETFARFWPSIYIICNEITGEQLFIDATGEMKN